MAIKLTQLIRDNTLEPVKLPERMTWTASSLKLFRTCKRKWYWNKLWRLTPRIKSPALMIGTAFHECLAEWYIEDEPMEDIVAERLKALKKELATKQPFYDQDKYQKLLSQIDMLYGMVLAYSEIYGKEKEKWEKDSELFVEEEFMINMGDFDFSGKIDLRVKGKKKHRLVEHKTASSITTSYIDRLPLDTQVRAYIFGCWYGLEEKVNEVVYDVVKKSKLRRKANESVSAFADRIKNDYWNKPNEYFYREPLKISSSDIAAFEDELFKTNEEYEYLINTYDPEDPRSWTPSDNACDNWGSLCTYAKLCTDGLDRANQTVYDQNETMNRELEGVWE